MDKVVPLSARGLVIFELKARRTTAPAGTHLYLHQIFHNGEDAVADPTVSDAWIDARVVYDMRADAASLTLRIRVENGCFLVDDVHVWLE